MAQPMALDATTAGRVRTLGPAEKVFTPNDILEGRMPQGKAVLVFDDDHYYMGSVLAEALVAQGTLMCVSSRLRILCPPGA